DLLERQANEVGEAAIRSADFAIEAKREEDVIEGIDQVAKALLRLGDHAEELLHLLAIGRGSSGAIETADHAFQFGDLLGFPPEVNAEQANENDEPDRKSLEMNPGALDGVPRKPREDCGDDEKKEERQPPKLVLALFVGFEAGNYLIPEVLRGIRAAGIRLWRVVHLCLS